MSDASDVDAEEELQALTTELRERTAEVSLLTAENERLREEYERARRLTYRRAAAALAVVGVVGLIGAAAFPTVRTVLLILGSTGVFAGILTYYLTPERFIPARVGERLYAAMAETREQLVEELGLRGSAVYLPREDGSACRLYVPLHEDAPLPSWTEASDVIVVGESASSRGISFHPTGAGLYEEFERTRQGPASGTTAEVVRQLVEASVEGFELARHGTVDIDTDGDRVTVRFWDNAYGRMDRMDHPLVSFVGVGLATDLGQPVRLLDVEVGPEADDAQATFLVGDRAISTDETRETDETEA